MYAIDSLRQLSMKYLGRDELINFTFQNDILKPFVILMRNSWNDRIRVLIVDCIVQVSSIASRSFECNIFLLYNYKFMPIHNLCLTRFR